MLFGEFVDRLDEPIEAVLDAYCTVQMRHPRPDHYLNPGCSEADLQATEQRLHHSLHPLHRVILRHSNGGDLPNIGGEIMWWAAAVPREDMWRPVGPLPPEESLPFALRDEQPRPVPAWVMEWRTEKWDPREAARVGADETLFLPFAAGPESSARIGYVHGGSEIAEVRHGEPLAVSASSFEQYLRGLWCCDEEKFASWGQQIRDVIATSRA